MKEQGKTSRQIVRFTLAATFNAQENIRKHFDELIRQNRPIKNDKERDKFFLELTYSCLGLAAEPVKFNYGDTAIQLANLEQFIRDLAYYEESVVAKSFLQRYDRSGLYQEDLSIAELWTIVRSHLFGFFPKAIHMATSVSKEKEESGKSMGFQVKND